MSAESDLVAVAIIIEGVGGLQDLEDRSRGATVSRIVREVGVGRTAVGGHLPLNRAGGASDDPQSNRLARDHQLRRRQNWRGGIDRKRRGGGSDGATTISGDHRITARITCARTRDRVGGARRASNSHSTFLPLISWRWIAARCGGEGCSSSHNHRCTARLGGKSRRRECGADRQRSGRARDATAGTSCHHRIITGITRRGAGDRIRSTRRS